MFTRVCTHTPSLGVPQPVELGRITGVCVFFQGSLHARGQPCAQCELIAADLGSPLASFWIVEGPFSEGERAPRGLPSHSPPAEVRGL